MKNETESVTDQSELGRSSQPDKDRQIVLSPTRHGHIYHFAFDGPIGDSLSYYGEWAECEIQFIDQFIREGSFVIDAGANIGSHTVAFARKVGDTGRVISFELSPEIGNLLNKTIDNNKMTNVSVHIGALGTNGFSVHVLPINPSQRQNIGAFTPFTQTNVNAESYAIRSPALKIDDLDLQRLDLIKMDIEGLEPHAIADGIETIKKFRPTIICEIISLDCAVSLVKRLSPLGFKVYHCAFDTFNRDNFKKREENLFGVAREQSLLFVPDIHVVPEATIGTIVTPISSLEHVATLFFECPRYGDRRIGDRNVNSLWQELEILEKRVAELTASHQNLSVELSSRHSLDLATGAQISQLLEKLESVSLSLLEGQKLPALPSSADRHRNDVFAYMDQIIDALEAKSRTQESRLCELDRLVLINEEKLISSNIERSDFKKAIIEVQELRAIDILECEKIKQNLQESIARLQDEIALKSNFIETQRLENQNKRDILDQDRINFREQQEIFQHKLSRKGILREIYSLIAGSR